MGSGSVPPQFLEFDTFDEVPSPPSRPGGELFREVTIEYDCADFDWIIGQIATLDGRAFYVEQVETDLAIAPNGTWKGQKVRLFGRFV